MDKFKSIKEYCESYFKNCNRRAWLKLKETRFKQIRDNNFFLDENVKTFKNEVLKFCELGYSLRNSEIRKRDRKWISFQNSEGQVLNNKEIIKELKANNLELHGNYSWSRLHMGVSKGCITDDMSKLRGECKHLFDENFDIAIRFNKIMEISGMGNGKASMLLHIKYPDKYGVWNSRTDTAFKILSNTKDGEKFRITGANKGEKYKRINEQLKWLLNTYKRKDINSDYGFENLSDVDIFMWFISK